MIRISLLWYCCFISTFITAQERIITSVPNAGYLNNWGIQKTSEQGFEKSSVFSAGFIDIVHNGQMQAAARLFRLYIGEPGKFQIPVSIFTGVSANNISARTEFEDQAFSLINPGSGIFNISIDGCAGPSDIKEKISKLQFQYQTGIRLISFRNKTEPRNINFFNWISGMGLTFVTGAWETDKPENVGMFWLNVRGIYSRNPGDVLDSLFGESIKENIWAYSFGMGIEILQTLHIKLFYFRFLSNRSKESFTKPMILLSANYSVK